MNNHILEALQKTLIPQHLLDSILNDCLENWKNSGVKELETASDNMWQKIGERDFHLMVQNLIVEISTVCNCILILNTTYDFQSEYKQLIKTKNNPELHLLKKELATRTIVINQKMSTVSGLPKMVVQTRLKEYLSF